MKPDFDIRLDRHEAKYVIPAAQVAEVRDFIAPFCEADPYGEGDPPSYRVTTLQLDDARGSLHRAKEEERLNRFKLRVRTYGRDGKAPVFLEVKRKLKGSISKSRAVIPADAWSAELIHRIQLELPFRSQQEELAFLDFVRLVRELDAAPTVRIRYDRESYFGRFGPYARVTLDRALSYQPATTWDVLGAGAWFPIDTPVVQNKGYGFSGVVLELKTLYDAPRWMLELVNCFGLVRLGHCKYSNAMWEETLFTPRPAWNCVAADHLAM